jgi:hypothetical protein
MQFSEWHTCFIEWHAAVWLAHFNSRICRKITKNDRLLICCQFDCLLTVYLTQVFQRILDLKRAGFLSGPFLSLPLPNTLANYQAHTAKVTLAKYPVIV